MGRISTKEIWARRLIRDKLFEELSTVFRADHNTLVQQRTCATDNFSLCSQSAPLSPLNLPRRRQVNPEKPRKRDLKICIIGAGISGLYAAMLLDSLQIPGLTYDILEASDQVGGRIRTHRFSEDPEDYFDVGAMRHPRIPGMKRTFNLFRKIEIPLIPYFYEGVRCTKFYNDVLQVDCDLERTNSDVFKIGIGNGGMVPDNLVMKGADQIIADILQPFKNALAENFEHGYELLMKYDGISMRCYLSEKMKLDFYTIQWIETMTSATGLLDLSFSECVVDSLDFDFPGQEVDWFCVRGGCGGIIEQMNDRVKLRPQLKKKVTSIALEREPNGETCVNVKVEGEAQIRQYDTVFSTTALPALQQMDLHRAGMHPMQKEAIRVLHYDSSTKVAIKFTHAWWATHCGITRGGVSSTDRPLRTCIYPSYGPALRDDQTGPAVLLCSYTWSQDAQRIGALTNRSSPVGEDALVELILQNLAEMHAHAISYAELRRAYVTHYSYDWSRDPYSAGAFALFGPGQFSNLYPYLVRPAADAKLHIVGEAASARHAWLAGSLDSVCRAVHLFLERFGLLAEAEALRQEWGVVGELEIGEFGVAHLLVDLARRDGDLLQK